MQRTTPLCNGYTVNGTLPGCGQLPAIAGAVMTDLILLALGLALFASALLYVRACGGL